MFENIFNRGMNVDWKIKDNAKSRLDLMEICRRPKLYVVDGKFPKACYTLDKNGRNELCVWVQNLRFPYGYASNIARCVNMRKHKLFGMKSHDCHVFMQRLIPIAFREMLPSAVWQALTELILFSKDLTSTVLKTEAMMRLESEIPIII